MSPGSTGGADDALTEGTTGYRGEPTTARLVEIARYFLFIGVVGFFFMLPTFVLVVAFSYVYFAYQALPAVEAAFYGINPVVIGLIVGACYSMAHSAFAEGRTDYEFDVGADTWNVDYLLVGLLVAATVVVAAFNPNPVVAFVVAGAIAVAVYRSDWVRARTCGRRRAGPSSASSRAPCSRSGTGCSTRSAPPLVGRSRPPALGLRPRALGQRVDQAVSVHDL